MFGPEGYIRYVDMVQEVDEWADRIVAAHRLAELGLEPSVAFKVDVVANGLIVDTEFKNAFGEGPNKADNYGKIAELSLFQKNVDERTFEAVLLTHFVVASIMLDFDTLLCSPDGTVLRAPEGLLLHMDRLDWCGWQYPPRSNAEFHGYYKALDEGTFLPRNIADRYCFMDGFSGVVALKNNSLSGYKRAAHSDWHEGDVERLKTQVVDPFIGWSIAWNYSKFPMTVFEIIRDHGLFQDDWHIDDKLSEESSRHNPAHRGRKPFGAKSEYFRRYPDSKPDFVSWEAISAELTEAGFPISSRMLQNYEKTRSKD